MRKLLAIATALLFAVPAGAVAQEGLPVVGGKAVLTIVPDTVYLEVPGECPDCPPPIICPPPTVCPPIPEWECPVGWTCTPPDDPNLLVMSSNRQLTDTLSVSGTFNPSDSLYVFLDVPNDPAIDSVIFWYDGVRVQKEAVWIYALNGANAIPLVPFIVRSTIGSIGIKAVVYPDAVEHTGVIEVVNPSLPPDTVPPVVPPDTVPPPPGDSTFVKQFGWRTDLGQWLGTTLKDDTLRAGDYVIHLELRNRDNWDGIDSVVVGLTTTFTVFTPTEHIPLDNNDGTVTFLPDKFYLLPYVVWGPGGNEFGVIEGTKANVHILPDLTGMLIPLDAPENIRLARDTVQGPDSLLVGPLMVRWDRSPQRSQGTQCEAPEWGTQDHCRAVNDPHINGDEVYSVLRVFDMVGTEIPLDRDPFGRIASYDPGAFNNLNPWSIPIPIPDTIRACVQFQAWDCWGCVGPGGQIPPYENEWGNMTRGVPLSETTCTTLEVQG